MPKEITCTFLDDHGSKEIAPQIWTFEARAEGLTYFP